MNQKIMMHSGYTEVNGLNMYHEVHGAGKPLVLIHGGGSTIETSFGNLIPLLSKKRQIIGVELQAHGHTMDRGHDTSFEQDADDVTAMVKKLKLGRVDILGFSNGGHTAIEIALRHPEIVNKIIFASTFYTREGVVPGFWDGFEGATLDMMPADLQAGYLKANNSKEGLLTMFNRDVKRMKSFKGWTANQLRSIEVPVLIINGTQDVGTVEHAVEMYRIFPDCELAIFPGGHGVYLGAVESLENGRWPAFNAVHLIDEFLER